MVSLDNIFRKKPQAVVGLDIGSTSIRLVELNKTASGKWVLESCLVELLQPNVVAPDGSIEQFDLLAGAVRRIGRIQTRSATKLNPALSG